MGYFPYAPATCASFVCALLLFLLPELNTFAYLLVIILVFFGGSILSDKLETMWGKDDKKIVIDEICGFLITMFAVEKSIKSLAIGFVLFRLFDILKPFPVNRSQSLRGGWGVMIDDVLAGVYSNIILRMIIYTV